MCSVNGHAEEVRHVFVSHEGKESLVVHAVGTRYDADFAWFIEEMCRVLRTKVWVYTRHLITCFTQLYIWNRLRTNSL